MMSGAYDAMTKFLSTPSARRATRVRKTPNRELWDFYPRPPRGGRLPFTDWTAECGVFLSTPSARRATLGVRTRPNGFVNFYPRPPRGGRPPGSSRRSWKSSISIHALREEGDRPETGNPEKEKISIHALREEGDRRSWCRRWSGRGFLSTPSARRATLFLKEVVKCLLHFYPRPPRGGRLNLCAKNVRRKAFLSTPSARRATIVSGPGMDPSESISIHALREEGDAVFQADNGWARYFYPRPPRGGRLFDDTHSQMPINISIHALREEGDAQEVHCKW